MTIAQQLEQKGIEKGRMEGRMEGHQEGIELGKRAASLRIARAMLQHGFDQNMVMQMTGLTEDELAHIRY
jgi:predicted transposase/invertase (TIGR01784 family)